MKRGEVRWYTFQAPDKRRPVLILTRDPAIEFLAGHRRRARSPRPCARSRASCTSTRTTGCANRARSTSTTCLTVPKSQIDELICTLSFERLLEVERAIGFALGFMKF